MNRLPLALLSLVSSLQISNAVAQEFKPYPRANITEAQWQGYFDEVRAKHWTTVQDVEDQKLLIFTDKATTTIYGFTKPGHPAHPACGLRASQSNVVTPSTSDRLATLQEQSHPSPSSSASTWP
jgi:hypothetical protein